MLSRRFVSRCVGRKYLTMLQHGDERALWHRQQGATVPNVEVEDGHHGNEKPRHDICMQASALAMQVQGTLCVQATTPSEKMIKNKF